MSQENVAIVQRALEATNSADIEEVLTYIDSDGELHSAIIGGAEGNVYRGHDGFRRWYAETEATFEELRTELTEFPGRSSRCSGVISFQVAGPDNSPARD
jgi:hypothetical protein